MASFKLTIITVTFNNIEGLRRTLNNISQVFNSHIQHVVIDGGSTDKTVEFLDSFKGHEFSYISENDQGIYDAMNKGVRLAEGEWINFMNAGDTFHADFKNDLNKFSDSSVLFGSAEVKYGDNYRRIMLPSKLNSLWKGMSFSHQSTFVKRSELIDKPFDLNYTYCADFNLIFDLYLRGKKITQINTVIAIIEAGGISDKKRYRATAEVFKINRQLNNRFIIYPHFVLKIIYGYITAGFKLILPNAVINSLLILKYK